MILCMPAIAIRKQHVKTNTLNEGSFLKKKIYVFIESIADRKKKKGGEKKEKKKKTKQAGRFYI